MIHIGSFWKGIAPMTTFFNLFFWVFRTILLVYPLSCWDFFFFTLVCPGQHLQLSPSTDSHSTNTVIFVLIAGLREDAEAHLLLSFVLYNFCLLKGGHKTLNINHWNPNKSSSPVLLIWIIRLICSVYTYNISLSHVTPGGLNALTTWNAFWDASWEQI